MNEDLESQKEEEEVLLTIYDGDPAFKQVSPTIYQYKCGTEGSLETFLLEVSWPETYPTQMPIINLDIFYNNHLSREIKEYIKVQINEKAEQYVGVAVTYTLFELAKEKILSWFSEKQELLAAAPAVKNSTIPIISISSLEITESTQKKTLEKKEHLTKAQKRRQWDKGEGKEDKPRGYNWVDIIKHLSQSGCKTTE